jgi:hypothetical protein
MSQRRYRTSPLASEDIDLEERYGARRYLESDIKTNPLLRSSFEFEELDTKYPLMPIQMQQSRQENKRLREEEIEYKKSMLAERMSEIEVKKASRDLDMFEATINREDAMLEQVPLARRALGGLDPRDPDYIKKRMDVYNEYPLAFEDEKFVNTVDKPLLYRNQQLVGSRREAQGTMGQEITFRDYKDAIDEVGKINRIAMQERGVTEEQLKSGEGYSDMELELLEELQSRISQYRAQRGGGEMPQGEPPLSPEPEDEGFSQQEYRPQSREEFNAIPSGAIFIDPQGNRRVKP